MRCWVIILSLISLVESCPQQCNCYNQTADCSNRQLYSIPFAIPSNTTTLTLRGNQISTVTQDDLKNLPELQTLILADNKIRKLHEGLFDSLPSLRRVSLTRNRLSSLHPLARILSPLISLDLRHNRLSKLDAEAFSSFPSLIQLDLSHNQIQSLPSTIFKETTKLDTLKLQNNPWNCDCRIAHIAKTKGQRSTDGLPKCFNPEELRGIPISEVSHNISCLAPTVSDTELHHELECATVSQSDVIWMYRGVELDFSSATTYQINGRGLIIPRGEDVHGYTCTHDYDLLPTRSLRQAHFRGGQPPQFTYKPKDSSYREGSAVKLHCEVVGRPKPTINWTFKGQILRNTTRKYELTKANSILQIYPFLESDVGDYKCTATNFYGRAEHTAKIMLVASVPPSITDGPSSQTVQLGQQVTFRCRARGVPRPDISWFFDGSVIPHIRGRFMVSSDGNELTISGVTRTDDGVYSCMAGNNVGAMMADARLTVNKELANTVDSFIDEDVLQRIASQAKQNVDRALNTTRRTQLSQQSVTNPDDLKRLFRFSIPAQAVELSKAREIYEESIRLVHEHVQKGLRLPVSQLAPNVSYEAVLAVSHIQTLMSLSGCHTGQVLKDPCSDSCFHSKYRAYDGQCNNLQNPMWGVASMPLFRLLPPIYENGFNTPVGWERGRLYHGYPKPNPREVSRQLVATASISSHTELSSMVMQWGQFVDHDLTHTAMALSRSSYASGAICNRTCENLDPCFNIPLAPSDPKLHRGIPIKHPCIEFERSGAVCGSGATSLIFERVTYRDQMNVITSFLDGSAVYGSSESQALELRDLFGDHGLMRFDIVSGSQKPYLPFEKDSDMDCKRNFSQENPIRCFLAGDLRANEQLGLASMHTVFVREHNRIAAKLLRLNPNWQGETIYQETRKIVSAVIQHITYTEWLPAVLGKNEFQQLIGDYRGYNRVTNPSIANAFATAAFRFGHTLINPTLFRLDNNFRVTRDGHLPLHKAFFAPERLLSEGGVDPLLRGLFASPLKQPRPDELLNTELTEKLFNRFHEVALDLASLNIQRGRDHALPSYVEYRGFCNLSIPHSWDDMTSIVKDRSVIAKLQNLYGHPGNIDLWVGGVVEEAMEGALMGPTFACIIADQFKRTRDGDRHWFENDGVFNKEQLKEIKKSSLARLMCDNGDSIDRVQRNVFIYPGRAAELYDRCETIPSIDLSLWTNCCDNQCPINSGNSILSRRRRSRASDCVVDGERKTTGEVWEDPDDNCTQCKCENGKIWCSVKEHCL